ncbi:MAG: transglutaminase domain-containing protein [Xanthomonadales bacterium]
MTDRRRRSGWPRALLASFAVLILAACASPGNQPAGNSRVAVPPAAILEASPLDDGVEVRLAAVDDILELSPEMVAFLDEYVNRDGSQNERLAQLVQAIIGGERFVLAYDDSTRTARRTFEDRRGNCISFTNMFVAMARNVNLDAGFQEVEIPPDWSMSGETYLLSKHVNAVVNLKGRHPRVIDFNIADYDSDNEMREIDDERARAHYYNNMGVERMLEDDTAEAYAYLRQSLLEDITFSSPWVNLGILHRREGYADYAESAYLQALKYDDSDLQAMSNLASLYQQEGREAEADYYLDQVTTHRLRNPYYRFQLAITAFNEGDYTTAIDHLKVATRKRDDDARLFNLLSLSYLMNGDREQAERWMQKAEDVAEKGSEREKYHHKLDLLRREQAPH